MMFKKINLPPLPSIITFKRNSCINPNKSKTDKGVFFFIFFIFFLTNEVFSWRKRKKQKAIEKCTKCRNYIIYCPEGDAALSGFVCVQQLAHVNFDFVCFVANKK